MVRTAAQKIADVYKRQVQQRSMPDIYGCGRNLVIVKVCYLQRRIFQRGAFSLMPPLQNRGIDDVRTSL